MDIKQRYLAVRDLVVGREEQVRSVLAVLAAGRDLLLEGPPGTSKSTILRAITGHYGIPLVFVEGNAELTPQKIIGYHDPAQVMRHGTGPRTSSRARSPTPCARRVPLHRGVQPRARRTPSTRCSPRWPSAS